MIQDEEIQPRCENVIIPKREPAGVVPGVVVQTSGSFKLGAVNRLFLSHRFLPHHDYNSNPAGADGPGIHVEFHLVTIVNQRKIGSTHSHALRSVTFVSEPWPESSNGKRSRPTSPSALNRSDQRLAFSVCCLPARIDCADFRLFRQTAPFPGFCNVRVVSKRRHSRASLFRL